MMPSRPFIRYHYYPVLLKIDRYPGSRLEMDLNSSNTVLFKSRSDRDVMNQKERAYHDRQIDDAIEAGDQEALFEARMELAIARAWDRHEETGRW
jgi:hypothetical protein